MTTYTGELPRELRDVAFTNIFSSLSVRSVFAMGLAGMLSGAGAAYVVNRFGGPPKMTPAPAGGPGPVQGDNDDAPNSDEPPSAPNQMAAEQTNQANHELGTEGTGTATVPSEKFSRYVFATDKGRVFESYGYTAADSDNLARTYAEQATAKVADGDYTLGTSDQYSQRITIELELQGVHDASGRSTLIKSGWMLEPNGHIRLITPFAEFAK